MSGIVINGETISVSEAKKLIKMLYNDAKQIAGEFHNMNRSEKFRVNWPDEYKFAASEWRNFVEAAIQMYVNKLGDPHTPEEQKKLIHRAIVLHNEIGKDMPKDTRLQIKPDSQQFWGDRYENAKILEKFGKTPNLRAYLQNSTATRH